MLKHHCLSPGDVLTSLEFSFLIILSFAERHAQVYIHLAASKQAAWISIGQHSPYFFLMAIESPSYIGKSKVGMMVHTHSASIYRIETETS